MIVSLPGFANSAGQKDGSMVNMSKFGECELVEREGRVVYSLMHRMSQTETESHHVPTDLRSDM